MRIPISVNLSIEMVEHARAFSRREQIPLSRIIEAALEDYIGSGEPTAEPEPAPIRPMSDYLRTPSLLEQQKQREREALEASRGKTWEPGEGFK